MQKNIISNNFEKSYTPELLAIVVLSICLFLAKYYEILSFELLTASAIVLLIALMRILEKNRNTQAQKDPKSQEEKQWQNNLTILESNSNRK